MINESLAPFYGMILTVVYTILAIGKYFQYVPMGQIRPSKVIIHHSPYCFFCGHPNLFFGIEAYRISIW